MYSEEINQTALYRITYDHTCTHTHTHTMTTYRGIISGNPTKRGFFSNAGNRMEEVVVIVV